MKEKNTIYMYYNHEKITFQQMVQIEYDAMFKATLSDHILFKAFDSIILDETIFTSLN